jgi:hypothetical protein
MKVPVPRKTRRKLVLVFVVECGGTLSVVKGERESEFCFITSIPFTTSSLQILGTL